MHISSQSQGLSNLCDVLNFCAPKIGHIFWPAISTFDRTQKQRHGDANGDGLTKTHLPHFSLTAAGEVGFTVIELRQNFTPPDLRQNLHWLNYEAGWCQFMWASVDNRTPVGESPVLIGPNLWLPLAATATNTVSGLSSSYNTGPGSTQWVVVISGEPVPLALVSSDRPQTCRHTPPRALPVELPRNVNVSFTVWPN